MSSNDGGASQTYQLNDTGGVDSHDEHRTLHAREASCSDDGSLDEEALLPDNERVDLIWRHQIRNASHSRYRSILNAINGKGPPRVLSFQPIFPQYQSIPSKLVSRLLPGFYGELVVTLVICSAWALMFGLIMRASLLNDQAGEYGEVIRLSCSSRLWLSNAYCGLNGTECEPFDVYAFAFRCPASCASEQILEPHVVGDRELNYQHYVIGGPSEIDGNEMFVYRGDSFICPAAIHAGITTDYLGGCGVLRRVGMQGNFPSVSLNGINSVGFAPRFPLSYSLEPGSRPCRDPQWILLSFSVLATCIISITTTSSSVFFSAIFCIFHFQVALASEPPYYSDFADIVSAAFGRLLPSAGVGFVIHHFFVRRCIGDLKAPLEKTLLWVGTCWVGALNKYTFDQLPISRLTPHDIQQQPGALTALIIILSVVVVIALSQAWAFRLERRLARHVLLYIVLALLLTLLAQAPALDLRIHHYIIALLLLPGTSLQTRPSLAYQGVLVGLFINGIARWDFASVLQTPAELLQDGLLGSAVPQMALSYVNADSIGFTIDEMAKGFEGISLLVNDVVRIQELDVTTPSSINWTRQFADEPVFLRFAFTARNVLGGFWYGDFTRPGVWWQNGTWSD
jgi:hypothetical protein